MAREFPGPPIEEIARRYVAGESALAMSTEYGLSNVTTLARLRRAGVTIRTSKPRVVLNLSEPNAWIFREIVDGLLLGDGSIPKKVQAMYLEQSERRDGWIDELQKQLADIGVWTNTTRIPAKTKTITDREMGRSRQIHQAPSRVMYTSVCDETRAERVRWYPDGVKRIPEDLILTPRTIALWFAGDGSGSKLGFLVFYTNGFVKADVERLAAQLRGLGVDAVCSATHRPNQYIVHVLKHDAACRLVEIMAPFLPVCCSYKVQHVRPSFARAHGLLTEAQVRDARARCANGETCKSVGLSLGVSASVVHNAAVSCRSYKWVGCEEKA